MQDRLIAKQREKGEERTQIAKQIELDRIQAVGDLNRLQISKYAAGFDGIMALTHAFAGEQSGAYQALFAVSKGFAVAESIIAIQTSIAKAATAPFPVNLALMGQAAARGAQIVSTIKGTQPSFEGGGFTGTGARTGGIDGKGGFNATLHPNEKVIDMTKGGGTMGNVTINLTINGDPNPQVVEEIKNASVAKALEAQSDVHRRKGSRSRALSRI